MSTQSVDRPDGRTVVVGSDGSANANAALEWAARATADRGGQLRVLMALHFEYVGMPAPVGMAPSVLPGPLRHLSAAQVDEARRLAAKFLPESAVSVAEVTGSPAVALIEASERADLLVVGNRGHGAFSSALLGSVSSAVAEHAHCPVVVVRGAVDDESQQRPVTVGVDGSDSSVAALEFAAAEASRRGVNLCILSAWTLMGAGDWGYLYWPTGELEDWSNRISQSANSTATAAADKVRESNADLVVEVSCPEERASLALEDASRRSSLLVVGTRGLTGLDRVLLGSVSRAVLHHASCPVAVVHAT